MSRRQKTKSWLQQHKVDPYVVQATQVGYRSRAAYKLLQLNAKQSLFEWGRVVIDLGASPGGWSQVAKEEVGRDGLVVAVDLLPMVPIEGVEFIQGDFNDAGVAVAVREALGGRQPEVVLSDMAPNISGIRVVDQARAMHLAELVLVFVKDVAAEGAICLVKVFQGQGVDSFRRDMERCFAKVSARKPKASKDKSREYYLLGQGFNV